MVRRVSGNTWPPSRDGVTVNDVPLGHISGAGSVIVASHAPSAAKSEQEGQDEHDSYGDVDNDVKHNFADDVPAGLEDIVGQKRARHEESRTCDEVHERHVNTQDCDWHTSASPGGSDCSTVAGNRSDLSVMPS